MRSPSAVLALALALTGAACTGKHNPVTAQSQGDTAAAHVVSVLQMTDAEASTRLLSGFYGLDGNTWRWTAANFSVLLDTPPNAAQNGAALTLNFTLPDVVIQKVGNYTLTASINGMSLQSAKYDKAGAWSFQADIPAAMLTTKSVNVNFALDKSFHTDSDKRELGVIATSVGLAGK